MLCKNCGNEMNNGATFCNRCGVNHGNTKKQINSKEDSPVINTGTSATLKKNTRSELAPIIIIIVIIVGSIIFAGLRGIFSLLVDGEFESPFGIYSEQEDAQQEILMILDSTPVVEGFGGTIGQAVSAAFTQYDVKYELIEGSTSTYKVTISGTYMPNPEIPQYTLNGSISYTVDIKNRTCNIRVGNSDIESILMVYAVNYL